MRSRRTVATALGSRRTLVLSRRIASQDHSHRAIQTGRRCMVWYEGGHRKVSRSKGRRGDEEEKAVFGTIDTMSQSCLTICLTRTFPFGLGAGFVVFATSGKCNQKRAQQRPVPLPPQLMIGHMPKRRCIHLHEIWLLQETLAYM